MTPPRAFVSNFSPTTSTSLPLVTPGGPILRSLLTTNGSITFLLEAFFNEQQKADKLFERQIVLTEDKPELESAAGEPVLEREILLRGDESNRAYLHAKTLVALNHTSQAFRDSLLNSGTPIGKLWDNYRMELFKEVLRYHTYPACELAKKFDIHPDEMLIGRSYRVFSNQRCIMLITESFPENLG